MNSNCSNLLDMRNLQEQVKKAFCYKKLFCPFTVWINCFNDLKNFANSRPFKTFSRSLEQFFLTVCLNNFGNKIPFLCMAKPVVIFFYTFKLLPNVMKFTTGTTLSSTKWEHLYFCYQKGSSWIEKKKGSRKLMTGCGH